MAKQDLPQPTITMPTADTYAISCTCSWRASVVFTTAEQAINAWRLHNKTHKVLRSNYAFASSLALREKEKNDCTVRALAHAADVPYDEAFDYLKRMGRRDGKAFNCTNAFNTSTLGGYKTKLHKLEYDMSFRSLIDDGMLPKRCIIRVSRHVCAVIDGVVYDTFKIGSVRKVSTIWEFTKS